MQRLSSYVVESINAKDVKIFDVQATLKLEPLIGMKTYYDNKQENKIRKNDREMLQSMFKLTKCKTAGEFVQIDKHDNAPGENMGNSSQGLVLDSNDGNNQQYLERMTTPSRGLQPVKSSHSWT